MGLKSSIVRITLYEEAWSKGSDTTSSLWGISINIRADCDHRAGDIGSNHGWEGIHREAKVAHVIVDRIKSNGFDTDEQLTRTWLWSWTVGDFQGSALGIENSCKMLSCGAVDKILCFIVNRRYD